MNYFFVAKLYNIELDTKYSKGKVLSEGTRISNGNAKFKEHFDNLYFRSAIGELEYKNLTDGVYVYDIGKLDNLKDKFEHKYSEHNYLDFLLRKAQHFANRLWLLKDNTAHVKNGYLQIYPKGFPEKSVVHSSTFNFVPTTASCEVNSLVFSKEELENAILNYKYDPVEEWNVDEAGWRFQNKNPLTKETGRIDRAYHFLLLTRGATSLPIKILNYCSILECLFTSDNSEVSYKVSERFAYYLGENHEERKMYFKLAKSAYGIRSKAIHGQHIKMKKEEMQQIAIDMDNAIRKLFASIYKNEEKSDVFRLEKNHYEDWFTELILK